jgi:release factor glutamine methyltransferase
MSNPPYVKHSELEQMHVNVKDYEPHSALFVPDEDPLLFYRKIAEIAIKLLKQNGFLFFEINEAHGNDVTEMLDSMGFKDIILRKDSREKERMVRATK